MLYAIPSAQLSEFPGSSLARALPGASTSSRLAHGGVAHGSTGGAGACRIGRSRRWRRL